MNESKTRGCQHVTGFRITSILTDYLCPKTSRALSCMIHQNRGVNYNLSLKVALTPPPLT